MVAHVINLAVLFYMATLGLATLVVAVLLLLRLITADAKPVGEPES